MGAPSKKQHCKLLPPDEKPYVLKKSKEKKSYKCHYKYSNQNVCGQKSTTYHRLHKHKKLNSHTWNWLQKAFEETERISHSMKKIRTQKEILTKYCKSKHVVQDIVDTEQETRSSDSEDIKSSYEDDTLEIDEDVGDLCGANIYKIKTSKVNGTEYTNCQTCGVWNYLFCCNPKKPPKKLTVTFVLNFKLCLCSRILTNFYNYLIEQGIS